MENNFDKSIKKLLENYEEEFKPSDWDLMEQKIEEQSELSPEMEDVLLDGMAYDSLQNFNVPFNPEHWELMNEKLDDPFALRRRLMKYKVAEVALVLLFIFTLVRFLSFGELQPAKKDSTNNSSDKVASNTITTEAPNSLQQLYTLSDQLTDIPETTNNKAAIAKAVPNQKTTFNSNTLQNEIQVIPNTRVATNLSTIAFENAPTIIADELEQEIVSTTINNDQQDQSISEKAIAQEENVNEFNTSLMSPILLKGADKLTIAGVETLSNSKLFSDPKRPIKVRIGMAIGPDANYVMTPYDNRDRLDPFNQLALGYSGGITLGFQYNRWEIETGALYSAVTYDSRNVFQIKGSFAQGGYVKQGLAGAELDLIRIPVNLKYNFLKKKKWNFYAYTGVSLNMAVEAFYNFTTRDVGQSDASKNFAVPSRAPDSHESNQEENIKSLDHAAYDGVFEGGTLSNNTFLTTNLGFGIERYFTPRISIFLQPGYQHQFTKGLGPQNDQINSLSILTGAKVTLKKKRKETKRY